MTNALKFDMNDQKDYVLGMKVQVITCVGYLSQVNYVFKHYNQLFSKETTSFDKASQHDLEKI
jgi:hypothetical protein